MSTRSTPQHRVGNEIFLQERNALIRSLAHDVAQLSKINTPTLPAPTQPKRLRSYQKLIPNVLIRDTKQLNQPAMVVAIAELPSLIGLCRLMHYQSHRSNQLVKLLSDPTLYAKDLLEIEKAILRFTRVFPSCIPGTPLRALRARQ